MLYASPHYSFIHSHAPTHLHGRIVSSTSSSTQRSGCAVSSSELLLLLRILLVDERAHGLASADALNRFREHLLEHLLAVAFARDRCAAAEPDGKRELQLWKRQHNFTLIDR